MTKRKLIVNLGLARCGTTATEDYFRSLPAFATPVGVKELKFFLRAKKSSEYINHFNASPDSILFESSPPYMHGGLDTFGQVISRIASLRDTGFEVYLLVNVKNLLSRAFSHYWHDINGHYAIYGRYWGIGNRDDPRRFENLYLSSFVDELSRHESSAKFLPELGKMLQHAVEVMGADRVRIVMTSKLDEGISSFIGEVAPELQLQPTKTRRIPGTRAPAYLYGGDAGATYALPSDDGLENVHVPAHCCVLFARRHQELLLGTTYDLKKIVSAESHWTKKLTSAEIPATVFEYLAQQRHQLANIPEECFLAAQRDEALEEIVAVPDRLSIHTAQPASAVVKKLLWERQTNDAERDGKVMAGRSGRLFLHNDMNHVMAQHSGALLLSPEECSAWKATLEERTNQCARLGIRYDMLFAPDTHALYREDISILDGVQMQRPVRQILDAYQGHNLHYPLKEMRDAREFGEICHETDSHWSAFGAFVAYRTIMKRTGLDVPITQDGEFTLRDKYLVGDLGLKFDPPRSGRTTEVFLKDQHSVKVWNNGVNNRGHMSLWTGTKRDLPKALLLTDSYGWKFQLFLSQSFSSLFVVHSPIFEAEAIDLFKPDYVISILAERFAYKVPSDKNDMTAIEHAEQKIPGTTYPDFAKWGS